MQLEAGHEQEPEESRSRYVEIRAEYGRLPGWEMAWQV